MRLSFMVLLMLVAGCGGMPTGATPDNQPATGPIRVNNASMRLTGMVPCGATGQLMCHDYDISFTLTNTSTAMNLYRMDTVVLTVNGVRYAPAATPSCSNAPWQISPSATSPVIDIHVQTDVPTVSVVCGNAASPYALPGLTTMPSTGTIGLAIEGVMMDASPFKATTDVTIF